MLILTIILVTFCHLINLSKLTKPLLLPAIVTHNKFDNLQTGSYDISNFCSSLHCCALFNGGEMWYVNIICSHHFVNYYKDTPKHMSFIVSLVCSFIVLFFLLLAKYATVMSTK